MQGVRLRNTVPQCILVLGDFGYGRNRRTHLSNGHTYPLNRQPYRAGPKAGDNTPGRSPEVKTFGDHSKGVFGGSFRARFDSFWSSPIPLPGKKSASGS